jgi:hypothetical protein
MSCPVIICTNPDDLSIGAAGNALYAVNQISLLQNCPVGCYCPAGTFPRVFTYLTDQIPPVVPVGGSGSVFILRLMGCISEISRTLPAEASASELRAAATAIQSEWAGQQAICDARAITGVKCGTFFSNDRLTFSCPNGQTLSWLGAYSMTVTKGPPGTGLTVAYHEFDECRHSRRRIQLRKWRWCSARRVRCSCHLAQYPSAYLR